jgi:hypothetical protein
MINVQAARIGCTTGAFAASYLVESVEPDYSDRGLCSKARRLGILRVFVLLECVSPEPSR